jgi:hypothetical protein
VKSLLSEAASGTLERSIISPTLSKEVLNVPGKPKEDYTEEEIGYMHEVAINPDKFNAMSVFEKREFLIDWVHAFPENHNQGTWFCTKRGGPRYSISGVPAFTEEERQEFTTNSCGTAACVAGWAVVFSGQSGSSLDYPNADPNIPDTARVILGLSHNEGAVLFNGSNSREDLKDYVEKLNAGEDIVPDDWED